MPKPLFYVGTAFCVFLALAAATSLTQQIQGGPIAFIDPSTMTSRTVPPMFLVAHARMT